MDKLFYNNLSPESKYLNIYGAQAAPGSDFCAFKHYDMRLAWSNKKELCTWSNTE
jgi:hypothetical protein